MASFEEALINTFRMYPVLYGMPLKDYKNEKVKANVWDKIAREMRVSGHNVSGTLTFSTINTGNRLVRPCDMIQILIALPNRQRQCSLLYFVVALPPSRWSGAVTTRRQRFVAVNLLYRL